jgi:hypothetical protein
MIISIISYPGSNDDTFVLLERWVREVPHIPVSILSSHTILDYGTPGAETQSGRGYHHCDTGDL